MFPISKMKKIFQRWFPPFLMLMMALWFFGKLQAPKDKDFAFTKFGELPVTANGRVQPMDSLARNSLLSLCEKQTLNLEPWKEWDEKQTSIPATEWLANVMMHPAVADDWPVFKIDNPDLVSLLKLPEKSKLQKQDGMHFSWNQIQPSLDAFDKENQRVQKIDAANRTAYENAVAKMQQRLTLYAQLRNAVQPADASDWPAELAAYEKMIPEGVAAIKAQQAGKAYDQTNFNAFAAFIERYQFMSQLEPPLILPPINSTEWRRMGDALLDAPRGVPVDEAMHDYAKMAGALAASQPDEFNAALKDYISILVPTQAKALAKARAEVFFNQMEPFYNAMVIYVLAGLLAIFSWFNLSETLRRCSVWLIGLAFLIHTTGLIYRMVLEGRPPVTNLYSSAIFIGWGAVVLGMILEKFYKNGIGCVVSAGIGFITLIIAHHLALEGDTMEMMRAVLDTNFWLATHVVAVTTGYASTFVAGFLATDLHRARRVHQNFGRSDRQIAGAHDLRHRLFRHVVQFCRHGARRHLGGSILGPVLGLGPEGKRRAHHRAVERAHPASALGRHHPRTRPRELRHRRQHRHELVVVRREHARHRPAQLWLHRGGVQMAVVVCREPAWLHRARPVASQDVEKFPASGTPLKIYFQTPS